MDNVCMFMYASCTHKPTQVYVCEDNTIVGDDLPMGAIHEFRSSPLCLDSFQQLYSVSGPSLVALTMNELSDDTDILRIGDMMPVSVGMNDLVANRLLSNKYGQTNILEYIGICTKYGLHIGKILVPKHDKLEAPKNALKANQADVSHEKNDQKNSPM